MPVHQIARKTKPVDSPRRCHRCNGTGQAPCRVCGGSGKLLRGADFNGHPTFGPCEGCFGRKMVRCQTCNGQLFV
jgi:hypothetical protein